MFPATETTHDTTSVAIAFAVVFSWRRNDMAESWSLCSGAGSAFHVDGPATVKLHGR